jgi:hypothetical protein
MKNAVFWNVSVSLVRTYVSEERIAFIIRVTRTGDLGITLAVGVKSVLFLRTLVSLHCTVLTWDKRWRLGMN